MIKIIKMPNIDFLKSAKTNNFGSPDNFATISVKGSKHVYSKLRKRMILKHGSFKKRISLRPGFRIDGVQNPKPGVLKLIIKKR